MEIPDDDWFRSDLNDDQKQAVRMMISTPDLAMVQGPPGTGKTTMIAEAAWHLTRQGKKVLLASQANLAVDNALERLAQAPSIRAIRLGRKGEKDHPFSQTNALSTYYAAIAQTCRQRTLDTWQQTEARQQELSRWLAAADLLAHDIAALREGESTLEAECTRLDAELTSERDALDQAEQESTRKSDARTFVPLLDNDAEWSGSLPEDALRVFYEKVASPLGVAASWYPGQPLLAGF
jgi:superfamily I DNA/RNA helicase